MAIAEPLYTDWLHQQIRVKPDHLAIQNLSAKRRNRLRNDYQLNWRGGVSGFSACALRKRVSAI
jgi:hypothetical protein